MRDHAQYEKPRPEKTDVNDLVTKVVYCLRDGAVIAS